MFFFQKQKTIFLKIFFQKRIFLSKKAFFQKKKRLKQNFYRDYIFEALHLTLVKKNRQN